MSNKHPLGAFIIVDQDLDARLKAAQDLNIPTAHILAPPPAHRTADSTAALREQFRSAGVEITVVFCGFPGESYESIDAVKKTIGLVPAEERQDRLQDAKYISDFAHSLSVGAIGLHVGFIPEAPDDPDYHDIVKAVQALCDHCQTNGQTCHLETGQETAETLLRFFHDVNRPNLAINFDPANMILYGSGEPIPALKMVGTHVKSVHCKDAAWSDNPGVEWGQEQPLGQGAVNMRLFLQTLKDIGYKGPLTIEREISGEQQIQDIRAGIHLLNTICKEIEL